MCIIVQTEKLRYKLNGRHSHGWEKILKYFLKYMKMRLDYSWLVYDSLTGCSGHANGQSGFKKGGEIVD